jgi:valyl-tRNA synthetase
MIEESNIKKKIEFYEKEIIFFEKKLNNKKFINKAPKKVVDENRTKLVEARKNLDFLKKNV